jgi:hypothetical protein
MGNYLFCGGSEFFSVEGMRAGGPERCLPQGVAKRFNGKISVSSTLRPN